MRACVRAARLTACSSVTSDEDETTPDSMYVAIVRDMASSEPSLGTGIGSGRLRIR